MRIRGKIIDTIHSGHRTLQSDCDFIQKEANIILSQPANALEGTEAYHQPIGYADAITHSVVDQILSHREGRKSREDDPLVLGSAASRGTRRETDFDICGPSEVHGPASRIQEEHE